MFKYATHIATHTNIGLHWTDHELFKNLKEYLLAVLYISY